MEQLTISEITTQQFDAISNIIDVQSNTSIISTRYNGESKVFTIVIHSFCKSELYEIYKLWGEIT